MPARRGLCCPGPGIAKLVALWLVAGMASALAPGSYVGEVCWRGQFTEAQFIDNPGQRVAWDGPEFRLLMQATYAGGGIYTLEGYISNSSMPGILIPKRAKAHHIGGQYHFQLFSSSVGIDLARNDTIFVDWQDTTLPEGLHWSTDESLAGELGNSRKLLYYLESTGDIVSSNAIHSLPGVGYRTVNPVRGVLAPVTCEGFQAF